MNKTIWVKTKCQDYYSLINKLKYLNINIINIKEEETNLYLKIKEVDVKKLQKFLPNYKFIKYKRSGIYYLIDITKRHYIYFICLIIGIILFLILSHTIVKINIIHENKEIREILQEELKDQGITIPSFRKNYVELEKIKNKILRKYPDKLDWLEIESSGMIYNIRVEERIITDLKKNNKYCDIVAKKDGTISNIKLLNGELAIGINDYVRKGDTLIKGNVNLNNIDVRNTCAKGEIYAEVWYKVNVSVPFKHYESKKTGKRKMNLIYDNGNIKKRILVPRFKYYESSYKPILKILNRTLYLEKEYEVKKEKYSYDSKEALNIAINKAIDNVSKKLTAKDKIIAKKVLKKEENNSTMDIEVFIVTEEEIGIEKTKELKKNDNENNQGCFKR